MIIRTCCPVLLFCLSRKRCHVYLYRERFVRDVTSRMTLFCLRCVLFCFFISFGQEVYPRKMRDKVRQQQLQIQMAQLYASEQVRHITVGTRLKTRVSYHCGVLWMCCCSVCIHFVRIWCLISLLLLHLASSNIACRLCVSLCFT